MNKRRRNSNEFNDNKKQRLAEPEHNEMDIGNDSDDEIITDIEQSIDPLRYMRLEFNNKERFIRHGMGQRTQP